MQRDKEGVGRVGTTYTDELLGYASGRYGGHPEYDDAGPADTTAAQGYLRRTTGTGWAGADRQRIHDGVAGRATCHVPTCQGGAATGRHALTA